LKVSSVISILRGWKPERMRIVQSEYYEHDVYLNEVDVIPLDDTSLVLKLKNEDKCCLVNLDNVLFISFQGIKTKNNKRGDK